MWLYSFMVLNIELLVLSTNWLITWLIHTDSQNGALIFMLVKCHTTLPPTLATIKLSFPDTCSEHRLKKLCKMVVNVSNLDMYGGYSSIRM